MPSNNLNTIINSVKKNPNYKNFYQKIFGFSLKRFNQFESIQDFPIIRREQYLDLSENLISSSWKNNYISNTMAGAKGDKVIFPLSNRDYQNYIFCEKRKFQLIGVKKTDLCAMIEFSQSEVIIMSQAFLSLGASYIPLEGDENKIFNDIIRYKVTVIFTIPPVVYRLMEYVRVRHLKTSLRLIITTGVKIPDVEKLNQETKSTLGAELIDTIGATELASFAFSCREHRNFYHFVDQYQRIEIIDPKTKKPAKEGEIVITPLWKVDFPLIRYGTSDCTKLEENLSCHCAVQNKTFCSGVEKRLVQSTRIQRYLVDLKEFYDQVRNNLYWQNFFDKKLWLFLEKPALAILITKMNHVDTVLVFIDKSKFLLTLRRRQPIEDAIFKMTNAETKFIFCNKKLIQKVLPSYQDIRDIPKKHLSREILNLLNLC